MQTGRIVLFCLIMVLIFTTTWIVAKSDSGSEEEIMRPNIIRVHIDKNYPPFQFINQEGVPAGFDVDVIKAIAERQGLDVQIEATSWYSMLEDLDSGRFDIIPGIYIREDRIGRFEFSKPFVISNHSFFVRKEGLITKISEIDKSRGLRFILQNNNVLKNYLLALNPSANLIFVESNEQALKMLAENQGDVALVPGLVGDYFIHSRNFDNIYAIGLPVLPREYCMAARKGNIQLIELVNNGLDDLYRSGAYQKIYDRWFMTSSHNIWETREMRVTMIILGTLVLIIIWTSIWVYILRNIVRKKELESDQKIAAIKQMELELRAAKESAEESNAFKSAFVANISHDLRTPLNAIVGFSDLLADPEATDKDRAYYNSLIQSNSKVLIGLINDIIDLSRIESKQLSIRMESFCPYDEMQALLPVLVEEQNRLSKSHLVIKLEVSAEMQQLMIVSDKNRFRQVLVNLAVNAIKFTKEGFVMLGLNPPQNGTVTFYVKDTGEGLNQEQQVKIFERFYRAERKNTIQGSGLGLAISRALVEMLGGEIGVNSISGVGSTFWFSLPVVVSPIHDNV